MPAEPQLSTTTGVKSFCMVVSKLLTGLLIDPPIGPLTGPHTGQPPTGRGGTVTAGLELRDQPGLRPTRDLLSISLLKSEKNSTATKPTTDSTNVLRLVLGANIQI